MNKIPISREFLSGKTFLTMKFIVIFMLTGICNAFAVSYGQNEKINIKAHNATLKEVVSMIENQSEYVFFYKSEEMANLQRFNLNEKEKTVKEILDILVQNTPLTYKISNQYIYLNKREKIIEPARQQQRRIINGKVKDEKGEAIIGANIKEHGTTNGTISDVDGNFRLQINEDGILHISYIGYLSQDISTSGKTLFEIVLIEDRQTLDELVVVGYGTQSKKTLTGAIASIKNNEIINTKSTDFVNKLQGKIAGLNIRQNAGQPGAFNNSISIRGFGTPLYIIDGVERPAMDFQRLTSEDIESITILKDASAAIYGLNAANGVVLVTTKSGENKKTTFQFSSNFGFSKPTNIVPLSNAYQYSLLRSEAEVNFGYPPLISQEELENWRKGSKGYESTDWSKETFKNYSSNQEVNLSAQGGSDKISFYLNANVLNNEGMLQSGDMNYKKINLRSNLTAQLTEYIKTNVNINWYTDKRFAPSFGGMHEIQRGVVSILPTRPVYTNNNPKYLNRTQDGQAMNPVAVSQTDQVGYSQFNNDVSQISVEMVYDVPFIKGLSLRGFTAFDRNSLMDKTLHKNFSLYDYEIDSDTYIPTSFSYPASIYNENIHRSFFDLQLQINYHKNFLTDHHLKATIVHERKKVFSRWSNINKYYEFYTNDQLDLAGEKDAKSGGNESDIRNLSYLGRFNYDYQGKYLFEFAGRYDGSYRYHPDVRWGFFPVVSIGWRISEERFMDKFTNLSNLKLRVSHGKIGLDAGAPFQYISAFTASGGGWYEFVEGTTTRGIGSPPIVNEKLTWMKNKITNIGLDLGFFNERLILEADIYRRERTGILAHRNVVLPNTYGGTFPQENLNSDQVQGFDLSLTHKNTISKDFSYNISGNFNFNRQKNLHVEQWKPSSSWDKYKGQLSNRNTGIIWTYSVIGQFQNEQEILNAPIYGGNRGNSWVLPGDWIYEDLNNDGIIDGNDTKPMFYGQHIPLMNFGLTLVANYRGFDINMLFQGSALFSKRYTHAYSTMFWQEANLPAYFMDRWHKDDIYNPSNDWIPGEWPAMRTQQYQGVLYWESNAWRKDASYIRFKNLELGYTFNDTLLGHLGIQGLRIYLNMNNLYTLTDKYLKYFDPEVSTGEADTGWIYPISRTTSLGFNFIF
ncbi:MAG: TonB-dependent receptor [Tissierellia bacterium]|jgi:TonB-linked SusC/RagA family outer membrane protein|nr:TonB-dependent receptor [Tissierellia bacterium]